MPYLPCEHCQGTGDEWFDEPCHVPGCAGAVDRGAPVAALSCTAHGLMLRHFGPEVWVCPGLDGEGCDVVPVTAEVAAMIFDGRLAVTAVEVVAVLR